jgi:hypothetical protein
MQKWKKNSSFSKQGIRQEYNSRQDYKGLGEQACLYRIKRRDRIRQNQEDRWDYTEPRSQMGLYRTKRTDRRNRQDQEDRCNTQNQEH